MGFLNALSAKFGDDMEGCLCLADPFACNVELSPGGWEGGGWGTMFDVFVSNAGRKEISGWLDSSVCNRNKRTISGRGIEKCMPNAVNAKV